MTLRPLLFWLTARFHAQEPRVLALISPSTTVLQVLLARSYSASNSASSSSSSMSSAASSPSVSSSKFSLMFLVKMSV